MRATNAEKSFNGKFVIITGGSKGIGLATAAKIFALGADLCIIARNGADIEVALREIGKKRIRTDQMLEAISCDTTDQERLTPLFEKLTGLRGSPDFLINCVGYARPGYVEELELPDYRRHMEVNYYGQLIPILLLLPRMLANQRGHIVNVSSVLGFMGIMGYAAYCPSKFAIIGLTEALRSELSHRGLKFSTVLPPDVNTPGFAEENRTKPPECREMSKRAGLLSADEVADAIISGITNGRNEITMGEATLIHWLYRHFPWLVRAVTDRDYRKAREFVTISRTNRNIIS